MYRLLFFCLLVSFVEIRGWHKPTDTHLFRRTHGSWEELIMNGYKSHGTGPCASAHQHGDHAKEDKDTVTEKGPTPFKETDDDNDSKKKTLQETFEYLSNKTAKNNKVNKNFCKIHSKEGALEYFTTQKYTLIIPLPSYDAEDIIVKIKNNVVYIKGVIPDSDIDPRFGEKVENAFEAIYKVPDIVDVKQVSWNHFKGRLKIIFFYKMPFNKEVAKTCDGDYNEDDELRTVNRINQDANEDILKILKS